MRRKWFVVSVAAASLTLATVGGAVFAGTRASEPSPAAVAAQQKVSQDKLFEKAGAKLGLDAAKVKDAHSQAVKAIERENRIKVLDQLVTQGRLTREQADALNIWLDSRPDALQKAPGIPGVPGLPGLGMGIGLPGASQQDVFKKMAAVLGKDAAAIEQAFKDANKELATDQRTDALANRIDQLVKDGVITEQEASDLKAWVARAPAFLTDDNLSQLPGKPFPGQPGPDRRFEFRGQGAPRGFRPQQGPGGAQPFSLPAPNGGSRREFQFNFGHGGSFDQGKLDDLMNGMPDLFREFGIPWQGRPDGTAPANPAPAAPPAGRGA